MRKQVLTVRPEHRGERLDRFLALAGGGSRGEIRRVIERGGVWLEDRRIKIASRPVRPGESFTIVFEEAGRKPLPEGPLEQRRVLFEDPWLVAVDKPAFVPSPSTLASDRGALPERLGALLGQPVGLVHRLDRMTSGVTVFGKRDAATRGLAAQFREATVRKCYRLVAWGALARTVEIDHSIGPDPTFKGRYRADPPAMGRGLPAWTRFEVRGSLGGLSAVEAFPRTGRTHQLRAHLAALGAPIVGDPLYGGPETIPWAGAELPIPRVLLHAFRLELAHPMTGAPLCFEAPMPTDLDFFWDGIVPKSG